MHHEAIFAAECWMTLERPTFVLEFGRCHGPSEDKDGAEKLPLGDLGRTIGEYVESEVERCIDVVELWAGVRSVAKAALKQG